VEPVHAEPVGQDATRGDAWTALKRKFVTVLVIGETARADHFSLGGYARQTNPRLSAEDIVYFPDVSSCGTATRVSLPCMFSDLGRAGYSKDAAEHREGLLTCSTMPASRPCGWTTTPAARACATTRQPGPLPA
jgi:lipid A ethanolaminephosphotransferase